MYVNNLKIPLKIIQNKVHYIFPRLGSVAAGASKTAKKLKGMMFKQHPLRVRGQPAFVAWQLRVSLVRRQDHGVP